MKGETRKVVSLVPKGGGARAGGDMGAKMRGQTVPPDPSFFFGSRVKLSGGRLRDPYREHAYFHAAVKRISAAISSAPFRIFRDSESKEGVAPTSNASRKTAYGALRDKHPELPEGLFNIYNARGEATRRRLVRDMYSDIRGYAPAADLDTVMRAIGIEIVDSGPWAELFRDVNPEMTRSQLWEASTVYMHQGGETFWVPLVRRGSALVKWEPPPRPVPGAGQARWIPAEIWPFGKLGWKPLPDKKRARIGSWEFKHKPFGSNEQKTDIFKHDQIGHYRFFDPSPAMRGRGLAPTEALAIELAQDHNAARYNEAFFERGAQLPWVMVFENGLSELQREDVEEQMLRDYSGLDNMWRPAVFEGNAKIEKIGMSQRDMDYHTLRQWVRDEVLAVIGTPKSELGIFQDANRASALVSKRVFWENTNLPLMRYYEDNTDSWLFAPVTGGTVFGAFDTSQIEALRDDLLGKVQVSEKLFKLGFTANEINERLNLGFDSHAARDLVWLNQNLKAHDENTTVDTANPAPVAPVEDGNGGGGNAPVPGGGENPEATDQVSLFDAVEGEPVEAGKGLIESVDATVRVFSEADTEALALVGVQAARVQRVLDTVRKRLVIALSLGIKNKLGRQALLAFVRAKLAFLASLTNISPVIRTEVAQITSLARNLEMRRKGVATNVWITSRDNRVRTPEHTVLDAKVGDVGFNFASLIPGHGGETLEFPLDPRASARLVIQCRCVLVPDRAQVTRLWDDEEKDRVWERVMGRVLDPNERRFEKMLSSILWRIRGAQLKRIEQATLDADGEFLQTPEQLAVPVGDFKKALTDLSTPIYKQTWSDAVDELGDELEEIGILTPDQFS